MRLAQITSGFVGGLQPELIEQEERPAFLDQIDPVLPSKLPIQWVGRAKLDGVLEFIEEQLIADPGLKLLVWSRFLDELERFFGEAAKFNTMLGSITGKSMLGKRVSEERADALRLLDPRTAPAGPALVG